MLLRPSWVGDQNVSELYIYAAPWIILSAERPLEAHVPGAVITHQSAEDKLNRLCVLELVPRH